MRLFPRLIILAALGWLMFVLFAQAREHNAMENADPTQTIVYFVLVVLVGVIMGGIAAMAIVPAIGDWVGQYFFSPNQEAEKDPHAEAMAKIAQGNFPGAIEAYRTIFDNDPSDTHALCEMAKIYAEKMHDPQAGAEVLETALANEWPAEQSALLSNRLADIYLNQMHDPARARALLAAVAESLPETKYAANAIHRMHEIDRSHGA